MRLNPDIAVVDHRNVQIIEELEELRSGATVV